MDNLFFLVSKLAWGILSPINLIIGLISLATILLWFNKQRLAKLLLTFCLLINFPLLFYPVSDSLIYPLENRFQKPDIMPDHIDGIIILGGGEELKISTSWEHAEMGNGGDRYLAAAVLAHHYPNVPVVFSGGRGFLRFQGMKKEAHIAYQLLTEHGIELQRIIIESQSRNTYENFLLLKAILPDLDGQYLLITSAYHMSRAVGIARKHNINVIAYPVDYRSTTAINRQLDFDMFAHLEVLEPAWREWIGLVVYFITGKIDFIFPKPDQTSK
jgi:uncharacterized SAM-binding protein YcdF (DUF218 family)